MIYQHVPMTHQDNLHMALKKLSTETLHDLYNGMEGEVLYIGSWRGVPMDRTRGETTYRHGCLVTVGAVARGLNLHQMGDGLEGNNEADNVYPYYENEWAALAEVVSAYDTWAQGYRIPLRSVISKKGWLTDEGHAILHQMIADIIAQRQDEALAKVADLHADLTLA